MTHVRLVGPDDDGRTLVVATAEGERFSLPVTEELKALVTLIEAPDGTTVPSLPPKEVQRRLRAGFTSEDLARLSGVPIEGIRRYEAPILAERAYIAELARSTRIGRDPSAPILGEVVADRLASRGVPASVTSWDAWRVAGSPWRVAVAYIHAGATIQAVWTFDHLARTVTAEDPESRWLTETDLFDVPAPRRHLAPVGGTVASRPAAPSPHETPVEASAQPEMEPEPLTTEELLVALQAKRGVRERAIEAVDEDADNEEFEGFGPVRMREAGLGSTSGSSFRTSGGGGGEGSSPARRTSPRRHPRTGRVAVPRWDEIVFGARTEEP